MSIERGFDELDEELDTDEDTEPREEDDGDLAVSIMDKASGTLRNVSPPKVTLKYVDGTSTEVEVVDADAQTSFLVLHMLHQAWSQVGTIKGVCDLAGSTMKTLETRRKLLNKQYGAIPSESGNSKKVFSLD